MISGTEGRDGRPNAGSRAALKLFVGAGSRTAATGRMLRMVASARARGVAVVRVSAESDADIVGNRVWVDATGDAVIEIDRIVALRPAAVVLDDLGRENGEGARHRWRWQDVNDLLDAGIDVLATVDVVDLASLSDITEAITGKPAEPTVPDEVFDVAEIEVVDEADASTGDADGDAALSGLRVLMLRRAALAIDRRAIAHGIKAHQAMDRVLVGISGATDESALVRAANRLATALHAPWHAIHVETPGAARDGASRGRAATALGLAAKFGATIGTVRAVDVAEGIDHQLRTLPASHLVLGSPAKGRLARLFGHSLVAAMLERHKGLSVHVLPGGSGGHESSPAPYRGPADQRTDTPASHYLRALALVAATSAAAEVLLIFAGARGLNLLYLLPVIAAAARLGLGPALVSVLASVAAANVLLVQPQFVLKLTAPQNIVMLIVLGGVAVYTHLITAQLRDRAAISVRSAQDNSALVTFAQTLARVADWEETAECVCREVSSQMNVQAVMLREKHGVMVVSASCPADATWSPVDQAALEWCWQAGVPTGSGTATLAAGEWRFEPLRTSMGTLAVLGIVRDDGRDPVRADKAALFATLVIQAALAHERLKLEDDLRRVASAGMVSSSAT